MLNSGVGQGKGKKPTKVVVERVNEKRAAEGSRCTRSA
jgi:hypothetical protein